MTSVKFISNINILTDQEYVSNTMYAEPYDCQIVYSGFTGLTEEFDGRLSKELEYAMYIVGLSADEKKANDYANKYSSARIMLEIQAFRNKLKKSWPEEHKGGLE